ncbi:unnamed protein product, partial [Sphacelaria rigidula]
MTGRDGEHSVIFGTNLSIGRRTPENTRHFLFRQSAPRSTGDRDTHRCDRKSAATGHVFSDGPFIAKVFVAAMIFSAVVLLAISAVAGSLHGAMFTDPFESNPPRPLYPKISGDLSGSLQHRVTPQYVAGDTLNRNRSIERTISNVAGGADDSVSLEVVPAAESG